MGTDQMDSLKRNMRGPGKAHHDGHRAVRRVARNSFFLFVNGVLGFVVRLATVPIVARYLGLDGFGLYAFIAAIAFTVGPTAAFGVTRVVCRELAKDDVDRREFFSTAAIVQIIFCTILMGVGVLLICLNDWSHTTNVAVLLALAGELTIAIAETYLSVTWAEERMEFGMIAGAIHKISLFASICLVVSINAGFLALFTARLGAALLYMLISAGIVYSRFLKPCFCVRLRYARSIAAESVSLCVARLQQALLLRVDVFVLKWLATPAAIGLFEVPHRLTTQVPGDWLVRRCDLVDGWRLANRRRSERRGVLWRRQPRLPCHCE